MRKYFIYLLVIVLFVSDFFVIQSLLEVVFNGTSAGPIRFFCAFAFIGFIDVVPVLVLSPAISSIIKGLTSRDVDPAEHNMKIMSVVLGIALFIFAVIAYCLMTVNNPQRFAAVEVNADSTAFNPNSFVTNLGGWIDNARLASIIFGLWPLFTTLLSFVITFSDIGDGLVNAEIKKCQKEIELKEEEIKQKQEDIIRLDEANAILDNLSTNVLAIKKRIDKYFEEKAGKLITSAKEEEDRVCGRAKTKIREDVLRKVDDIKTTGKSKFEKAKLIGSDEYGKWQGFVNASARRIMAGLDKS